MGADFSRIRNNPLLDFSGVELKQGGVLLDADFNELVAIVDRRLRAAASDIMGRSAVSSTTPDAFRITTAAGTLLIGQGRLYVDGVLAENHGAPANGAPTNGVPANAAPAFDPLLAEPTFVGPIRYDAQPYFPNAPALPTSGRHLVYLDVWNREVSYTERPELVEPAVGVETSSRVQTVWQVHVLSADAGRADCGARDEALEGWSDVIARSAARLTTGTFDVPPDTDPCELPPSGGYRGLENQTYRVEIHDAGAAGAGATFKFSRDNGSVTSRVAGVISATELELQTLGRDDVLRFNSGDWVEILDDTRELSQRAGEMRRITVNEAMRHITFTPPLPADMLPAAFPDQAFPGQRNLRVRRWEQGGVVRQAGAGGSTSVYQDLDAAGSGGVINVPSAGTTLLLEHGITVRFGTDANAGGGFRAGDYWVFVARTADASVEALRDAPPRGIHHHYARLGIWNAASGAVTDCRTMWPPRGEGEAHDCGCTQCVTPESHESGALTIQSAVDRVRERGGTVCLAAGQYQLEKPVDLTDARSVRIRGHGTATLLIAPRGAFSVSGGLSLTIEDLAILSLDRATAIVVRTALGITMHRLVIGVLGSSDAPGVAISLGGAVLGATIRDNVIVAPVGVRTMQAEVGTGTTTNVPPSPLLLTAALRIEDNVLWCAEYGVVLAGRLILAMTTRICGNEVLRCRRGAIAVLGLSANGSSLHITGNGLNVTGAGLTIAANGVRIEGNTLTGNSARDDKTRGAGILVRTALDPGGINVCHILANRISGFGGSAVSVQAPVRELAVQSNSIERCANGIVLDDEARFDRVHIADNQLSDIGNESREVAEALVGIGVMRAESATITGNVLHRIGVSVERSPFTAGVYASGVARLRVSGNEVVEVAPAGEFVGMAAGIAVYAPYADAQVTQNHVDRDRIPSSNATRAPWYALRVDAGLDKRTTSPMRSMTMVPLDKTRTMVFGGRRPYVVSAVTTTNEAGAAVVRGASASVVANVFAARGMSPAVDVEAPGDCLFNDNRCELRLGRASPAVQITAGTIVVSANRVSGGEASVQLRGDVKRMTVLGNITTGAIVPSLGTPWDALNVRA